MEAGKEWCFSVIQVIQVCECPNGWNRKNSENICTFGEIKILFNHFWSLKNFYFNVKFKIVKFKYEALHESYFLVIAWNTMVIFNDVKLELSPLYFLLTSNGSMQVKQTYFFGGGGGGRLRGERKDNVFGKPKPVLTDEDHFSAGILQQLVTAVFSLCYLWCWSSYTWNVFREFLPQTHQL